MLSSCMTISGAALLGVSDQIAMILITLGRFNLFRKEAGQSSASELDDVTH